MVSICLPRGVSEEGATVSVGDLHASAKLEVAQGGGGVELSGFVSEPNGEWAMRLPPHWSGLERGGKTTALSRPGLRLRSWARVGAATITLSMHQKRHP